MFAAYQPKYIDYLREKQPFMFKTETVTTETQDSRPNTEAWPLLLTKKFLAIRFGCWSDSRQTILTKRFRARVLTPEVLHRAGIDPEVAYSCSCKEFDALQSQRLTQILRS